MDAAASSHSRRDAANKSIRVGVVGVGNCASSLLQTVAATRAGGNLTGITHPHIGGYGVMDIEFTAAFDVDSRKISRDLSEAIFAPPNCTTHYVDVPPTGVTVSAGVTLDGVPTRMQDIIEVAPACDTVSPADVASVLRQTATELVLIFLPVGASQAADAYAAAVLEAGCSLINFTPARLATSSHWARRFGAAGKVLLGDDTKSQLGSTVVHRALLSLMRQRGIEVDHTYQLNVGGNADFKNMKDPERAGAKARTKLAALREAAGDVSDGLSIVATPSEYVPALRDFKNGHIEIHGTGLLGMQVSIEVKLSVEDSPNAAAVAVDAIRIARVCEDRGFCGAIASVCAQMFKDPPRPMDDSEATAAFDAFVESSDASIQVSDPGRVGQQWR